LQAPVTFSAEIPYSWQVSLNGTGHLINEAERRFIMKRSTIAKAFTIAAVTALALGIASKAKADGRECSNATLKGTFADKDTGFITSPASMAGQFAGANLETFGGNGTITVTGFVSLNGNIVQMTGTGTYRVNPDCTGTYTVQYPGLTVHGFFVIDDDGNELQVLITDPGTVISCVARRQFPKREEPGPGDDSRE
jgi:hypothetical protein